MNSRTLELLIGTQIENPALLPEPRPPMMKRMCCGRRRDGERCDLVLGWVICRPSVDGEITMGFCEACYAAAMEELDALRHGVAATLS